MTQQTHPQVERLIIAANRKKVLRFDSQNGFILKSKRKSPYFFNAALFQDGEGLDVLSTAYAHTIPQHEGLKFDVLFGMAYKGIPLAAIAGIGLYRSSKRSYPIAFNRKEAKDHGEGGDLVGESIEGKRVLIIDDVITAGTAAGEAIDFILRHHGIPAGLVVILDRQERGTETTLSAVQEVRERYQIPVVPIITFTDILGFLKSMSVGHDHIAAMERYRAEYGVVD